jgi:hypothetical protein
MADKYRVGALVAGIIALVLWYWSYFIVDYTSIEGFILHFVGFVFFIISIVLLGKAKKILVDERELRISAKAGQWGNAALIFYAVAIAILSKGNPQFISLPLAMLGVLIADFGATAVAFQILIRMPNAEIDRRETQ